MLTKFSEFFTLATTADDFQKRIYNLISDATTIVECYGRLYAHMVGGLKWVSRKARYNLIDQHVDQNGFDQIQMTDAEQYLTELIDLKTAARFEYLAMIPQSVATYGDNVFSLEFDPAQKTLAQKVIRQIQLYSQIQTYNAEYDRHDAYQKASPGTTAPLPNGKININPAVPINPDDPSQFKTLTDYVDQLANWIRLNYADFKAVLAIKLDDLNDLFTVIQNLPDEKKADAICNLLEKMANLGDSKPASTHKAFAQWVLQQLTAKSTFWDNPTISAAYQQATNAKFVDAFLDNTRENRRQMYSYFRALFTDFLSTSPYKGELPADAQTRRTRAFNEIKAIFQQFVSAGTIKTRYEKMLNEGIDLIQSNYEDQFLGNLLPAGEKIPQNTDINPILHEYSASILKKKADDFLRTLPLLMGNTPVSFSTIQNYEDLWALNHKSITIPQVLKSSVDVHADPEDDNPVKDRPMYRAIRFGDTFDTYIAFCNLPNLAQGTFYFKDMSAPAIATVTRRDGKVLTLDFQNYTITYPGKTNHPTMNDAGKPYREFGSVTNFFDELKATTKWKTIPAVRRYDPYYVTNPADPAKPVARLTGFISMGLSPIRTLPVVDSLCLWIWNWRHLDVPGSTTYSRFGEVLGLPASRELKSLLPPADSSQAHSVQIGNQQCQLVNYGQQTFQPNGFHYQFIGVTFPKAEEEFYVQVNTPFVGLPGELARHKTTNPAPRTLESEPKTILTCFDFSYFRRIKVSRDPATQEPMFDQSRVIQLFSKGDARKPTGAKKVDWSDKNYEAIEANLPLCFNLPNNVRHYYTDKRTRGKVINKGNVLFRERKPRKDAGAAMKPIQSVLKPPLSNQFTGYTIPATRFANGVMLNSPAVQRDWGTLKAASGNSLPVNQEWCHLRGHGDGGDEYAGNFVSGSLHCNTEQLAIESGQRLVTYYENQGSYVLHTTAYLLRDATNYRSSVNTDRESQVLSGNYLDNQTTYQSMLQNNTARRSRELTPSGGNSAKVGRTTSDSASSSTPQVLAAQPAPQPSFPQQGAVAPVAAYIRYKVMATSRKRQQAQSDSGGRLKVFDFLFEGQSEFIDPHQYALISHAVHCALAGKDQFAIWYKQKVAELDQP